MKTLYQKLFVKPPVIKVAEEPQGKFSQAFVESFVKTAEDLGCKEEEILNMLNQLNKNEQ